MAAMLPLHSLAQESCEKLASGCHTRAGASATAIEGAAPDAPEQQNSGQVLERALKIVEEITIGDAESPGVPVWCDLPPKLLGCAAV